MFAELFYDEMKEYLEEYLELLRTTHSPKQVDRIYDIIFFFVEFIYHHERCNGFEDITVAMTNSKFRPFLKSRASETLPEKDCKLILNCFFSFIYNTYGIKNDKIFKGIELK